MINDTLFRSKAPTIMDRLMKDFSIFPEDAASILGNAGHECGGFHLFQEQKPLVPGSRGGFGWFQWTGPRRRQFEAFVKAKKLDPKSDEANYGWLVEELRTTERAAIPAVKRANGLRNKVEAFERSFERAGIKHYDSRMIWAERALDEWKKTHSALPPDLPPPPVVVPKPPYKPSSGQLAGIIALLMAAFAALMGYLGLK